MKLTRHAFLALSLIAVTGNAPGDEVLNVPSSVQPISLGAMIASGRAKVLGSDPEVTKRLVKAVQLRKNARELEVAILKRTEQLLADIFETNKPESENRVVTIESADGSRSFSGTLIDCERGWIVTSLDAVESESHVTLVFPDGNRYSARPRILSVEHNLAYFDLFAEPHADFQVTLPVSTETNEPSGTLIPGAFLAVATAGGRLILGNVTSLQHFDENETARQVRNSLNRHWEHSGIPVSSRRTNIKNAIVCDLPLAAYECGSPAFQSNGRFAGVVVARTDQHEAILIPAQVVMSLLGAAGN